MNLIPVACALGVIVLLVSRTLRQQISTLLATAGGVGIVVLSAMSGDAMIVVFSVMAYLIFLIIYMSISDAVGRRRALRSSQSGLPVTAPAPASYRLQAIMGGLCFVPVALLAVSGYSGAVYSLIGLAVGIGLMVVVNVARLRGRR
jgi:hypothetical protein